MNTDVFSAFVQAINTHDEAQISVLTPDSHLYIDPQGNRFQTAPTVMEAWKGLFALFPDYAIEIQSVVDAPDGSLAYGYASGSWAGKKETERSFRIPMAFRAEIKDGRVQTWQVFGDTRIPDQIRDTVTGRNRSDLSVQGIGGVFFRAKDPKALGKWYDEHLGTRFGDQSYCYFEWRDKENPGQTGGTTFSFFSEKSEYFAPSEKAHMMNLRVNNLDLLFEKLNRAGVQQVGEVQRFDYGNFGWIMDPEGNKIELWEPVDAVLEEYEKSRSN